MTTINATTTVNNMTNTNFTVGPAVITRQVNPFDFKPRARSIRVVLTRWPTRPGVVGSWGWWCESMKDAWRLARRLERIVIRGNAGVCVGEDCRYHAYRTT